MTFATLEKRPQARRKATRAARQAKELNAIAGLRLPVPFVSMMDEKAAMPDEASTEASVLTSETRAEQDRATTGVDIRTTKELHEGQPGAFVYIDLSEPVSARRAHDITTFRDDMGDSSCVMNPIGGRVRAHYPLRRFCDKLYLLVAHLDASESLGLAWMQVATVGEDGTVTRSYAGRMSI